MSVLMKYLIRHYQLGGKTLYYNNTYDGATDDMQEVKIDIKENIEINTSGCGDGGCTL